MTFFHHLLAQALNKMQVNRFRVFKQYVVICEIFYILRAFQAAMGRPIQGKNREVLGHYAKFCKEALGGVLRCTLRQGTQTCEVIYTISTSSLSANLCFL